MRKIIHLDADCFFAAIEMRDNPRLRGRPIAVGGSPSRRGVIATCSYEARQFGVRSAMPSAHALRLCPDLQIIAPNIALYKQVSRQMQAIFSEYSERIEPLSLDEAYLDVSDSGHCQGSATWIARDIQHRIQDELAISVSAGVAPVRFLAKIASDWYKPNGQFVILPQDVEDFTAGLTVNRLPGVGVVTSQRMQRFGLNSCSDIRRFGLEAMQRHFGQQGQVMYERAWGRDPTPIQSERIRKSVSVEQTFPQDYPLSQLNNLVPELLQGLEKRFQSVASDYVARKYFVKLKFDDFSITTQEAPMPSCWRHPQLDGFCRLLHSAWVRVGRPVRLIGLGLRLQPLSSQKAGQMEQLSLF